MLIVTPVGRTTADLELSQTRNGKSYVKFAVACRTGKKNREGNTITTFLNCTAWNKAAEILCKYAKKGTLLALTGDLLNNNYEKDGVMQYSLDFTVDSFELLEGKAAEEARQQRSNHNYNADPYAPYPSDDDLPR